MIRIKYFNLKLKLYLESENFLDLLDFKFLLKTYPKKIK